MVSNNNPGHRLAVRRGFALYCLFIPFGSRVQPMKVVVNDLTKNGPGASVPLSGESVRLV